MPEITHYLNQQKQEIEISKMSKGYIKNEIAHINRTSTNTEYLPALEKALKIKMMPKFNWTKPPNPTQ